MMPQDPSCCCEEQNECPQEFKPQKLLLLHAQFVVTFFGARKTIRLPYFYHLCHSIGINSKHFTFIFYDFYSNYKSLASNLIKLMCIILTGVLNVLTGPENLTSNNY